MEAPGVFSIVGWNILHGGGAGRTAGIALALREMNPDVVVLSEFRCGRGSQLRAVLADAGLEHQAVSARTPAGGGNGILIASRLPLRVEEPSPWPGRWLSVRVGHEGSGELEVCGVHVPDDTDPAGKARYWRRLVDLARGATDRLLILLGDFNTARRGQDQSGRRGCLCEAMAGTLLSLGFCDAWRRTNGPTAREDSWSGPMGVGARLDTAYLSPPLVDALHEGRYEHGVREAGLSDHSALVVSLRLRLALSAPRGEGLWSR